MTVTSNRTTNVPHPRMPDLSKLLATLALVVLLAGCVTTTDSPFAREEDKAKAVQDYVQLATAYIAQGNFDRARDHLKRALSIDPSSAPALATMGLVHQRNGESQLAEESFQNALSEDSDYTRGHVYYGAFLYSEGQYEKARQQFAIASQDTGYEERASVFYNLGRIETRLGNTRNAATAFERSVKLSRGDPRYLLALSTTLVEIGDFDSAASYYNRLTDLMRHDPKLRHSPESLLTGIRIARHFQNRNVESSLALVLRNQYPNSDQYQQYKVLISQ